jgi:hypothetical protein
MFASHAKAVGLLAGCDRVSADQQVALFTQLLTPLVQLASNLLQQSPSKPTTQVMINFYFIFLASIRASPHQFYVFSILFYFIFLLFSIWFFFFFFADKLID